MYLMFEAKYNNNKDLTDKNNGEKLGEEILLPFPDYEAGVAIIYNYNRSGIGLEYYLVCIRSYVCLYVTTLFMEKMVTKQGKSKLCKARSRESGVSVA